MNIPIYVTKNIDEFKLNIKQIENGGKSCVQENTNILRTDNESNIYIVAFENKMLPSKFRQNI